MVADNPNLAPHMRPFADSMHGRGWPPFAEAWFGDTLTYPTGRGQQKAATGWECPSCHRCWAPQVLACHHCGPPLEITDEDYER